MGRWLAHTGKQCTDTASRSKCNIHQSPCIKLDVPYFANATYTTLDNFINRVPHQALLTGSFTTTGLWGCNPPFRIVVCSATERRHFEWLPRRQRITKASVNLIANKHENKPAGLKQCHCVQVGTDSSMELVATAYKQAKLGRSYQQRVLAEMAGSFVAKLQENKSFFYLGWFYVDSHSPTCVFGSLMTTDSTRCAKLGHPRLPSTDLIANLMKETVHEGRTRRLKLS